MTDGEGCILPYGTRCRAPHLTSLLVPQIDDLRDRIARWIVVPRCKPKEVAVLCPGKSTATLRHDEAAVPIGDDVGPWSRRNDVALDLYFVVAIRCEAAEAIVQCYDGM